MSNRSQRRAANRAAQKSSRGNGKVIVAYLHSEQINATFDACLQTLQAWDREHGHHIIDTISHFSSPRIAPSRNMVVEAFLSHRDEPEWLFFTDDDMAFAPDTLARYLEVADPVLRPIVGGLCFAGGRSGKVTPTIYTLTSKDPIHLEVVWNYPPDQLVECDATGAANYLIHRSVLLALRERYGSSPYPYYAEATSDGLTDFGEDITFCLRARAEGFPVHVDTRVKIGHMKMQVIDEHTYMDYRRKITEMGEDAYFQWCMSRLGHIGNVVHPDAFIPRPTPTSPVVEQVGDDQYVIVQPPVEGDVEGSDPDSQPDVDTQPHLTAVVVDA